MTVLLDFGVNSAANTVCVNNDSFQIAQTCFECAINLPTSPFPEFM